MSGIGDKLSTIWQSISNISSQVISGIGGFFQTLWDWLTNIVSYINPFSENFMLHGLFSFLNDALRFINPFDDDFILKILFDWISDLIKSIFVPDTAKLKEEFNEMLGSISDSFGISFESINEFKSTWSEKPIENITSDYSIYGVGTLKLNFLDTSYLLDGIDRFRPVIRGFVVLLLLFYSYSNVLSFIGQDPGIAHTAEKNAEKHLARKERSKK